MNKGLIIKEPWIDLILNGKKTWEIRNKNTLYRGKVYLIKSGSSKIFGECTLINSQNISFNEFLENTDKHMVKDLSLLKYDRNKLFAWILVNPKLYEKPISYTHPKGAIVWVDLDKIGVILN